MSLFDGEFSSREIGRKIRTEIAYMCLAAMEKPSFWTIARFKVDYSDLIDEAFKTTIKIAKENDLIKIYHLSLDGTKIKVKTSINKVTGENQIKIMKELLKKSIGLDQEEDGELGEESRNSVSELLTDITQNPTDHFVLIPSTEQLENNLTGIYDEMPPIFNSL